MRIAFFVFPLRLFVRRLLERRALALLTRK